MQTDRDGAAQGGRAAFDVWLQHGLRRLYAEVADEPVPAELVALVLN